jgi:hypothetical protein
MASEQRERDAERIRTFTRRLTYGAVAATSVFGGLAAAASHQSSSTTSNQTQVDDSSTSSNDDQSFSAPTQSYQPPVAQSGGS